MSLGRTFQRSFARKSVADLRRDADTHGLRRTLGPFNLLFIGIGCILGAGIYVMPGNAAANFAGPAVLLSFIIAGAACAFTGLCYAELASTMPVSGSAYTYCYASVGEVFAWMLGWMLLLEYGLSECLLAVGFSGYFASFARDLGWDIPQALLTPLWQVQAGAHGTELVWSGGFNLVAALSIAAVTAVLTFGISASAFVNNILVLLKVALLTIFIALGIGAIDMNNWVPFVPENEGGFHYGWPGVMRGASIVFFAYLGFETVSTAASEARNPSRDLPFGIIGALIVCTLLYMVVAAVLTGVVNYRDLAVADPIAVAVDRMGHPQLATLVKLGAVVGIFSVLLINAYSQTRMAFAMSRDGLLPPFMSRLHRRFRTPHLATLLLGGISSLLAGSLPLSLLGDLTSVTMGIAFSVVCLNVMWLRSTQPHLERPFKVPLGGFWIGRVWIGYVPTAAIVMCWAIVLPVLVDIGRQAARGQVVPLLILGGYALSGLLLYFIYGQVRSRIHSDEPVAVAEAVAP